MESKLSERVTGSKPSLMVQLQREAEAAERAGNKITWLLRGEPDFGTPQHIIEAGKKALDAGYSHYTSSEGVLPLRQAIAERLHHTMGLEVDPSEVIVTTGATMGIYIAFMTLLNPGDEVIVPEPYYGPYATMCKLAGGRLVTAPLLTSAGRFGLDVEAIAARITDRTKAILINSPMNPTGAVFTKDELTRLGELAVARNVVVISDECYDSILYDGRRHLSIAAIAPEYKARTIIVNSFSKSYAMTGWRLGFTVAPKVLTQGLNRVYSQSGRCAAAFTQQAGLAALHGPQDVVTAMVDEYGRRRDLVMAELDDMGLQCARPEGAFYVFPDCAKYGMKSVDLSMHVLNVGQVAVTPGLFFGPAGDSYLRLSYATSEDELRRGLAGLRRALESLPVRV